MDNFEKMALLKKQFKDTGMESFKNDIIPLKNDSVKS